MLLSITIDIHVHVWEGIIKHSKNCTLYVLNSSYGIVHVRYGP